MIPTETLVRVARELQIISNKIINRIVAPVCSIPAGSIWADSLTATLATFVGSKQELGEVVSRINEAYQVDVTPYANAPLAVIAFVVLLRGVEWEEEETNE